MVYRMAYKIKKRLERRIFTDYLAERVSGKLSCKYLKWINKKIN